VILVDANILIYAFDADSPQHASARRWLDGRLNDTARVALPWPSLLAFLRLVTNPRAMQRPASMEFAHPQVRTWPRPALDQPSDRLTKVKQAMQLPLSLDI
jgi:uncharacterized protein